MNLKPMAIEEKEMTEGALLTGALVKTGGVVLTEEQVKIDGPVGEKPKIKGCKEP
jgi:hypothetical protein